MNPLSQTVRALGPLRLATMGIVAIASMAFFLFLVSRLTTADMSLLYGDLSLQDSANIVGQLETQNIPYELRANGTQVFVPANRVQRLRLTFAADGVPSGGSVGYELFDEKQGFGTSSFVQQLNQVRALEGELARTISELAQVSSARVHLVMPKRELFSRERQEATASVVLRLRSANLGEEQVRAIRNLVAMAVPGLAPRQISIVDDKGNLLARGYVGDEEDGLIAEDVAERTRKYETRLARTIEVLLQRSVGPGNVRAEVSAQVDFDRVTTNDEIYDPDGTVIRSTQTVEEADASSESNADQSVSIATNLPGAAETGGGPASTNRSSRTEETVNFEVSRTVRTLVRESGVVRRLSVAVLIDGNTDGDGNYVQRTPQEMEQITALVKSAIGYDSARGDVVEVVNLRFTEEAIEAPPPLEEGLFGLTKQDLFRIAELFVLGVVAVLVILLVIRPIVTKLFESMPAMAGAGQTDLLTDQSAGAPAQLTGPDSAQADAASLGTREGGGGRGDPLDLSSMASEGKSSATNQITQIAEKHPEETIAILRGWMYQDS